jgi:tetratricopeptide (TPR) repeat protein
MRFPFFNSRTVAVAITVAMVSVLWFAAGSTAQVKQLPKPSGHVNDFADVLDSQTRSRLEHILENLQQRAGLEFTIAIVKSVGTQDLYDYSLAVANDWNLGAPASPGKSLLLVMAADNGKFFSQVSKSARASLPDGVIGEMGLRMRPKLESNAFSQGLLTGIQTFAEILGQQNNFALTDVDPQSENQIAKLQRPRVVKSQPAEPAETPAAQPTPTPAPQPSVQIIEKPAQATPSLTVTMPPTLPAPTPSPESSVAAPTPQASETPAPAIASPTATPSENTAAAPVTEAPLPKSSSEERPRTQASPTVVSSVSDDSARLVRTPAGDRKTNVNTPPANPDDEKEEVELTLTKPAGQRIDLLKAFIAAHPQSVAVPRANELIVAAHAQWGDQKLKAGDTEGGLRQFSLAISEAPPEMSDGLFTEVIARIPMNLFLRRLRVAAIEAAHQAEPLAKLIPRRLLALAEFYLTIEDAGEANRIAELAVQNGTDSAAAHQALGAARHIALRLDEAESEYARALTLDPKYAVARIALADLRRASGKFDAALTLYRDQLQADANSKSARAGLVLSLLELGKKNEADQELNKILQDKEQAHNLPLLVGAAYWFAAHNDPARSLDLAQKGVAIEPRYSWAQIALARALLANRRPLEAERALRFARQYSRFPTLDYELANALAALGLYDEAAQELARSFTLKDGQIETRLAGRTAARAATFGELLAPERRAAIFQSSGADLEANAKMLKGLLAFSAGMDRSSLSDDEALSIAQDFIAGDDGMRTFRLIYVSGKFVRKKVALSSVADLMDSAIKSVEAALSVPGATVAVQPEELSDMRARALAQGATPDVPDAPRTALSGLLRGRIEDLAGLALFNLDKHEEAATHLRRAVSVSPEGTPLWRAALWHLGSALEANGKNDQALLYYIKSYVTGPPDPARRSVIESVYKKVNGTLEGLDDKIGPNFATATATPSP